MPTSPPSSGSRVVRAADGAFLRIAPQASTAQVDEVLAQRAARRRPQRAGIRVRGDAPQIFGPALSALAQVGSPQEVTDRTCAAPADASLTLALHAIRNQDDEDIADADLAAGLAVVRVHREDDVLFVHPLADPSDPRAVRAVDVRARRMAASPAPEHLARTWHEVGGDPLLDLPPVAAALAAAHVLESCLDLLHQVPTRGPSLLFRLEMTPLRRSEHPVLRVPETEPLP
ncbi:hypothetical protein [Arsenicicoccus dermatophilus]|uniref:hypothetical protein n=1 Tax=Arsenicicoccus dermatophilus TaxID=1076331 RepID=UPI001F4C7E44|nr:hypothetical protein [Arsenicicoccus dermatophilus]MCH8611469.1 hypothetical protein [Arsenicicoccus dermatophilus]